MWYAYDLEFIERGPKHPIELISLGMKAGDGRELYVQNLEFDYGHVVHGEDPWLRENVLPHLVGWDHRHHHPLMMDGPWFYHREIAAEVLRFMNPERYGPIEKMIGYFSDYDHVVFCQLFGRMIDLPKGFKMWTYDIKQEASRLGIEWLGREVPHDVELDGPEHHALSDARWNARAYRYLLEYGSSNARA